MRLGLIVAYGRGRVIGKDNALPWRLPADLRRFRQLTLGKPVIMGRRTFLSIGRPLDDRRNIVLTRDPSFQPTAGETHRVEEVEDVLLRAQPARVEVAHSVEEALALTAGAEEAVVIGGAEVYAQFLPRADVLYITEIDADFEGDRFFPQLAADEWREVAREEHEPDERNRHRYRFVTLERRR